MTTRRKTVPLDDLRIVTNRTILAAKTVAEREIASHVWLTISLNFDNASSTTPTGASCMLTPPVTPSRPQSSTPARVTTAHAGSTSDKEAPRDSPRPPRPR